MNIEEVGVNLSAQQKPYRHDARFVAYMPGGTVGDAEPFADAVRSAIALGAQSCVGFLTEEPEQAAAITKRGGKKSLVT